MTKLLLSGPNAPLVLTLADCARLLRISRALLGRLIAAGEIPVIRVGKRPRVPIAALESWIAAKVAAAGPIPRPNPSASRPRGALHRSSPRVPSPSGRSLA